MKRPSRLADIKTIRLDQGGDADATREHLLGRSPTDAIIAKRRKR